MTNSSDKRRKEEEIAKIQDDLNKGKIKHEDDDLPIVDDQPVQAVVIKKIKRGNKKNK